MTTALTGASQASDTSLVTERAIATVLADKVDTLTNDANNGTHPLVTALTKSGGTITVTKGEVTIPVGSVASPTSHAEIWIE